jgi:queuine/archaeosine tRNA-ribosyltransferase
LYVLHDLVAEIRYNIERGSFAGFKRDFLAAYESGAE